MGASKRTPPPRQGSGAGLQLSGHSHGMGVCTASAQRGKKEDSNVVEPGELAPGASYSEELAPKADGTR